MNYKVVFSIVGGFLLFTCFFFAFYFWGEDFDKSGDYLLAARAILGAALIYVLYKASRN